MSSSPKENAVQQYLSKHLKRDWVMINYIPHDWWEADFFSVLPSGLTEEHEIKFSYSDYNADFKKAHEAGTFGANFMVSKHDLLSKSGRNAPNRFWFCVSDEIADKIEVPDYAGLKVFSMGKDGVSVDNMKTVKNAPLVHAHKPDMNMLIADMRNTSYYRHKHYWENVKNKPPVEACPICGLNLGSLKRKVKAQKLEIKRLVAREQYLNEALMRKSKES